MTTSGNGQMKKSPEQLEREIDQERQHIMKTLDAIGGKFSADEMFHRISGYARRNGGEFSRNLVNTVARNPVPTMLTAIGIGWMLYQYNRPHENYPVESAGTGDESSRWSTAKQRTEQLSESVAHRVDQLRDSAGQRTEQLRDSSGQRIDQLRESAGHRAEQIRQTGAAAKDSLSATKDSLKASASGLKGKLETSVDDLKHRFSETSAGLRDRASHLRHASQRQAQRASDGFNYMVEERPLVLGAVGIALGALIGAALPSTRREDRLMGGISDRAADEASTAAHEALDKAAELGKKVQGYAAEDAREKAAEFGRDVQDYAKSEAREAAAEVGKNIQDHARADSKTEPTT